MAKPANPTKAPVEYVRQEVEDRLEQYERIRAAVEGEDAVKKLEDKILPRPNAADTSTENRERYRAYLQRAVWFPASGRTLGGLTGYVFQKEPVVKLPATLKNIETNIDGTGVTLNQQAKETLRMLLSLGRAGLLVDYPIQNEAPTTRQQLLDGNVSPTIVLYDPTQIINWRTSFSGAKQMLDMVVLKESYHGELEDDDDEFSIVHKTRYRVLTRDEEGVHGRVFIQPTEGEKFVEDPDQAYEPRDKNGQPLKEIPFTFLGIVNNDSYVDTPPLLDMVNLNFAHFRNSADYEESVYMVGQPTPWVAGLTQTWVETVLKGTMQLGSRAIIPLPENGSAGLLQADPNTLAHEAMKHKEEQMVRIGAKLVSPDQGPAITATEANMDHASEVSILISASTNMFLGYKAALAFAGIFVGQDTATIEFDLTEPLGQSVLPADQATALMGLWQGGLIDFEEARWSLKKGGLAWKDDKVVQELVANEGLPANPNAPADPNAPPPKPGGPKPTDTPPPAPHPAK